jgi:hypothetical protein
MNTQHSTQSNNHDNHNAPIRNVRAFLKSYLKSKSAQKALSRVPIRAQWHNSALAQAFARAAENEKAT